VVSDQITDENFDEGYEEVVRIVLAIKDPWFDGMREIDLGAIPW